MRLPDDLPQDIDLLLKQGFGVVDARTAALAGVSRRRLARLAERNVLIRLAHGCYADRSAYEAATPWDQYELRSRAFIATCGDSTFLAEWSAVKVWDLPTMGEPPAVPVAVHHRSVGRGGSPSSVGRVRVADLPKSHRLIYGDEHGVMVPIMSPAWTVADLARTAPVHHALVVADAALRKGEPLRDAVGLFNRWRGQERMRFVLAHADGLAESPIETLGRFTCIQFHLPMPVSNAWIGDGWPERRVDGHWPWHHAVHEADGAIKYDNRPDASKIVREEKEREWELRRLGVDFVRYGYREAAYERRQLAARFNALLHGNPPQSRPIRWWKHDPEHGPVDPLPEDQPSPDPSKIILPAAWSRTL